MNQEKCGELGELCHKTGLTVIDLSLIAEHNKKVYSERKRKRRTVGGSVRPRERERERVMEVKKGRMENDLAPYLTLIKLLCQSWRPREGLTGTRGVLEGVRGEEAEIIDQLIRGCCSKRDGLRGRRGATEERGAWEDRVGGWRDVMKET